jgi:hypothetical protein
LALFLTKHHAMNTYTRVYPKVSGLVAWSENCKWYSSLLLDAVISRSFVSQSSEFCLHNPLCCFSTSVYRCLFRYGLSPETLGYTLVSCLITHYTMKTLDGCVSSFTPRPLYPRGKPSIAIGYGPGWPQSRPGCGSEEEKSYHCPFRESNAGRPARSLVTMLSYSGS